PTSLRARRVLLLPVLVFVLFFFNVTPTTAISTLSLHDALPISPGVLAGAPGRAPRGRVVGFDAVVGFRAAPAASAHAAGGARQRDRKSTRLNSSHEWISYAVFCLKKKTRK